MNVIFYYNNKQILFNLIFLSLIIVMNSFIAFKPFSLSNNNILLVTEKGIYRFNLDSQNIYLINSFNNLDISIIENVDINKFSDDEGGYIFCKIDIYIYIFSKNADTLIDIIILNDNTSGSFQVSITPYISDNNYYCILIYINIQHKIQINKFKINFNSPGDNELTVDKIIEDNNMKYIRGITCQLLYSSKYQKNILICFVTNMNDYLINSIIFNPEDMSLISVEYKNIDFYYKRETSFIRSIINYNNQIFLICQDQNSYPMRCQLYDFENNIWSDYIYIGDSNLGMISDFNLYMTSKNEYIFYYNNANKQYKIHYYDKNYKGKCSYDYQIETCEKENSYNTLLYNKDKLYLLINCYENENNTNFSAYEVKEECNDQEKIYDFNLTIFSNLFNSILSSSELKE